MRALFPLRRTLTTLLVVVGVACNSTRSGNASALAAGRRLSGDVVLISMSKSFNDIEQIRATCLEDKAIEHATLFSMSGIHLTAGAHEISAVLKLVPLDTFETRQLGLGSDKVVPVSGGEPRVVIGNLLAQELDIQPGALLTVATKLSSGGVTGAPIRCMVASLVHLGIEHFDKQLVLADMRYASAFNLEPTGIELRLFEPASRIAFAQQLQQKLGSRFRAIPLEELVAPLLASGSAARR